MCAATVIAWQQRDGFSFLTQRRRVLEGGYHTKTPIQIVIGIGFEIGIGIGTLLNRQDRQGEENKNRGALGGCTFFTCRNAARLITIIISHPLLGHIFKYVTSGADIRLSCG
ncbi:MAG TPA: hypothetical protein PLM82_12915 [Candidatus Latescibacteria bacterium]|nr:hypothetical protein [Candidatus Latescibacterota bacterium]HRT29421.1 hypothetical protein [Kiritimatiellia bacterium]